MADVALLLEAPIFLAQPFEFLAFLGREAIGSDALIQIGLLNPVADRLVGGFKLIGQFIDRTTCSGECDDLLTKLLRVWWTCSWRDNLRLGSK